MKEYLELYKEMLFQALETQEDDEYQWYMLDIKDVLDPDGWSDTYSVWVGYPKNEDDDSIDITNPYYVCIFGDDPTNSYKDWECDSYEEAIEFFTFYGEDEYDEDGIYSNSDICASDSEKEFDDMGNDIEYWYYTRHGVGPGSVPKGLGIERYAYDDDDPYGEYFSVRGKTIRPKAMKYYDIKEKIPKNIR